MSDSPLFEIDSLEVCPTDGPAILHGVSLRIEAGEVHAIMGPHGSGTSALATTVMGSPEYEVTAGAVRLQGDDITHWDPDVRAKAGMFLAFQHPQEISGVSVRNLLHQAISARKGDNVSTIELYGAMQNWMERLEMDPASMDRHLSDRCSSGEEKRTEMLQLAMLEPDLAVLDETAAGLDADALEVVAKGVHEVRAERPEMGVLLLTHHQRLVAELAPDHVHVLVDGRIVASGGVELAEELERDGYQRFES